MKKLIIRDHLMQIVLEKDIYMEGADFVFIAPAPFPLWVKEIYICSPEDTDKFVLTDEEVAIRAIAGAMPQDIPEVVKPDNPVKCRECGWTGSTLDCSFGHNDFYCPECGKEALEPNPEVDEEARQHEYPDGQFHDVKEVNHEPEATNNQGTGDKGSGKAGLPEDSKELPESNTRAKSTKSDKHPRKPKTA